jgi:alkanesulfonate monooxygenase SsuD/methylene tetrahydromethanopterin reductase-like flavin-dependent oxidoreductase (luciferase family)
LDQTANRELFEEQVEIIFKAFNEESFSHRGKHYTLPPNVPYRGYELQELTLVPRPLHRPVQCWQPIQGGSQRALDFMARMGIKGVVGGGSAEGGAMHRVVLAWQEAQARVGRQLQLGEDLCFGYHFYIADSREQGIREAGKYYEENLKMFGPLRLVRALTDQQIDDMGDPKRAPFVGLPTIEEAINKGGVLCGSPDDFIEHLKKLEERYPGLERVMASLTVGIPKTLVLEQLERFATEVMPAFKATADEPVVAD